MTQDTLSPPFRTSVLPSVLRSFDYILFISRQLNALADLFHANRLAVLDHDPHLTEVQRPDHLDQLFFGFGQNNIRFILHKFHLQNEKTAAVPSTAAAVFLQSNKTSLPIARVQRSVPFP